MQAHFASSSSSSCSKSCMPLQPAHIGGHTTKQMQRRCSQPLLARPAALKSSGRTPLRINAMWGNFRGSSSYRGSGWSGSGPSIQDRVLAAVPYILPFLNVFQYGRFLFYMYPTLRACIKPIFPALALYHSLPLGSLIAFFGVYLGIVNNRNFSRFVRFNAMQAILLDIILVLPRLVETVLTPPKAGYGFQLYAHSQSFVWIFIVTWVVFGIASCAAGHWARIPFIADSADVSVR
ncbi:hypothetical protein DUNSADRAFT_2551 [Dunaliella salina]|uniref:Protein TIC 20 n=1 Tax=Dunaliella salina TaxID=3046 RepID=A0ABQ7FW53_DUNSA|nr:hypothetical protein DUNSADRAFT_2551 [Dunaliella salina]|eukprot:KAF5826603.1 hypothetical protein DUNSADRAFT_2551 [Dunaliella salina]